jgi:hypothetical protein
MSSLLYVPCASWNPEDLQSVVKLCLSNDVDRIDTHDGRKAAIKYIFKWIWYITIYWSKINLKKLIYLQVFAKKLEKIFLLSFS